jgi:hypothetical protein
MTGSRRARVAFPCLLLTLLLLAPASFHLSVGGGIGDGLIEYRVAERLLSSGRIDLPGSHGWVDPRVRKGPDGRTYSIFGIGQSLLFSAGIVVDRIWVRIVGPPSGSHAYDPLFFSATVNCWVHAATGVLLYALLVDLGLAAGVSLITVLLYTFGSMGLRYAMLSFDVPLANGMLLGSAWCLVRANASNTTARWVGAGVFLGMALVTRIATAVFLLPMLLYVLLRLHDRRSDLIGGLGRFVLGFTPFVLAVLALNAIRFGSPFETGYTSEAAAFGFDAPLLKTIPALLISPGRGIFFYSPYVILSAVGIRSFVRKRPAEALLVLGIALLNFVLFAANRNWATANAWGARYQLLTVLMLSVPFAFWLDGLDLRRRRGLVVGGAVAAALTIGLQVAWLLARYPPAVKLYGVYWSFQSAQIHRTLTRLERTLADGKWDQLNVWWLGPHANDPGTVVLLLALLLLWTASIVVVWHTVRVRRSS